MRCLLSALLALALSSGLSFSQSSFLETLTILNPQEGDEIQSGHNVVFEILVENVAALSSSHKLCIFLNHERVALIGKEELQNQDGIVRWNLEELLPATYTASAEVQMHAGMH